MGSGAELAASGGADVADGEVKDFEDGVIGGEMSFRFRDFAELVVEALDGVRGVNDPADLGRELEERDELFPAVTPRFHHGRVAVAPLDLERVQRVSCRSCTKE